MPALDTTTSTLEIVLGGAPVTQLGWTAKYDILRIITNGRLYIDRKTARGFTNSATPVTMVPAPSASDIRHELMDFYLVQENVADTDITIQYNDNGTRYKEVKHTLSEGDNLRFS